MKLRSMAALVIIAATGVCAQTAGPSGPRSFAGRQRTVMATSTDAESKTGEMRAKAELNQRMMEMETTLGRMHLLLKQMQASAAVKNSKDPVTKANLEMWGLMIQQLDKQFEQVKVTARERADLTARRYSISEVRSGAIGSSNKVAPPRRRSRPPPARPTGPTSADRAGWAATTSFRS